VRTVHVLRKPLDSTTVDAILTSGVGGINVDFCRVGTSADVPSVSFVRGRDYPQSYTGEEPGWSRSRGGFAGDAVAWTPKGGRWPANLIFSHQEGCFQDGTRQVATGVAVRHNGAQGGFVYGSMGDKPVGTPDMTYSDENGKETIPAWSCAPGCPVAALDFQSRSLHSRGNKSSLGHGSGGVQGVTGWGAVRGDEPPRPELNDSGGASRFFKQFGGRARSSGQS
jgi:hypothetical protein